MSRNRNYYDYLQKASFYDLLANYYKYTNPNNHIAYYQKHLQYMNMAVQSRQNGQSQMGIGRVRFVHASTDASNVDIYIDGIRILQNFSYKEGSKYLSIPAGRHQVDIYPAGNMVSTVLSRKIDIKPGKHYSLIPVGSVMSLKWLALEDDPRVPSGGTKVRFIHLTPDAPAVDIALKNREVLFPNLSYRKFTNYLELSPMIVDFEARVTGSSNVALQIPQVHLKPNLVTSIIIIGLAAGEPEMEAIILTN